MSSPSCLQFGDEMIDFFDCGVGEAGGSKGCPYIHPLQNRQRRKISASNRNAQRIERFHNIEYLSVLDDEGKNRYSVSRLRSTKYSQALHFLDRDSACRVSPCSRVQSAF